MKRGKQLFHILLVSVLSAALAVTVMISQRRLWIQAEEQPEDGLILYYNFDVQDSGSAEIRDISGNGNTGYVRRVSGTIEGNYSIDDVSIYGKSVKALSLLGEEAGTYLELPDGILDHRNAVTISLWVKLTGDIPYQRIWDFGTGMKKYMYLLSDGANTGFTGYSSAISTTGYDFGNGEKGVSKGDNIDKNRWVLTTVVMNGSHMSLFANGEQIGRTVNTGMSLADLGHTTQNYVGYSQYGDGPAKGQFAEVKIYGRALTAKEIRDMYYVDEQGIVSADKEDLQVGDTSAVTEDIVLPQKGINGASITWTSQNEAVAIQNNSLAKVTRPAKGGDNASGTITAEIRYKQASVRKSFDVNVLAEYTDQQVVEHDLQILQEFLGNLSELKSDIALPATGEWGSSIRWKSYNSAVKVKNFAVKIARPQIGADDAVGKLQAVLTSGREKKTFSLDITVPALRRAASIKKTEQIHVFTQKGRSPFLPNYVKAEYTDGTIRKLKTIWPVKIDKRKYARTGNFKVKGSIAGEEHEITADVTVTNEKETVKTEISEEFDLSDISLDKIGKDGSILTQNRDRALIYLKLLDNRRMLYNFYKTFNQNEKIQGVEPLEGWETASGLLRGHSTGHYISALSLAYASTKDEEINDK